MEILSVALTFLLFLAFSFGVGGAIGFAHKLVCRDYTGTYLILKIAVFLSLASTFVGHLDSPPDERISLLILVLCVVSFLRGVTFGSEWMRVKLR